MLYNNSGKSGPVSVSSTLYPPAPPTPDIKVKSRNGKTVVLEWTKPSGATSFVLRRQASSDPSDPGQKCLLGEGCVVDFPDTNLNTFTDTVPNEEWTYHYNIGSKNVYGVGPSSYSNVKVAALVPPPVASVPSIPTLAPTVSGGANGTPVSITALPVVTGAAGYRVYRSTTSDFSVPGVLVGPNPAVLPIFDTLAPGTYYYRYLAFNATGNSLFDGLRGLW